MNLGGNAGGPWGRAELQSESWKSGGQGNYEARSLTRQTATVAPQHSVIPWQDPKVLNVLSQAGPNQSTTNVPM